MRRVHPILIAVVIALIAIAWIGSGFGRDIRSVWVQTGDRRHGRGGGGPR